MRKGMNIYKRKDGRWEGRYKNLKNGKYESVYGKTFGDVREKLLQQKNQLIGKTDQGNWTVEELFEIWLDGIRHNIKLSTYANYQAKLRRHIYPALGHLKYESLTSKHITDFINEKLSTGRLNGGALSAKYVSDMVMQLKCLGKFAELEFNCHNPMRNVAGPKLRSAELAIPIVSEQNILKEYLLNNLSARSMGILLCLFTGIRIGELCALRWSDFSHNERVVKIDKTVQRVKSFDSETQTVITTTTPKSGKSIREIPLPDYIFALLRPHKRAEGYFLSGSDKLVEPRVMQYYLKSVLRRANLPPMKFHMLRHIFATNCVSCGFDIKTLSEILGHASIELTLNRYVHTSRERKKECMALLQFTT